MILPEVPGMISSEELSFDVALAKVLLQVRYNPLQNWIFIRSTQKVKCRGTLASRYTLQRRKIQFGEDLL